MASVSAENNYCDICMHVFNEVERKAVTLPCGHDFCLTCLIRLKTAASQNCPTCRSNWSEVDVEALPGMALIAEAAKADDEGDLLDNLKKGGSVCVKHGLHYEFWSCMERKFYCKKCVIELGPVHSELQLIEDAVPLIKKYIADRVVETNEIRQMDLEATDNFRDRFVENIKEVSKFSEQIQHLEEKMNRCITNAEVSRRKSENDAALVKKVSNRIEKINSEADIAIMLSSLSTLDSLTQPLCLPVLCDHESLLCNIACTYTKTEVSNRPPSSAAFIAGLLEATGNSALPLTLTVREADKLVDGEEWSLDNSNCLAAVLALQDRQPGHISLRARHDQPDHLPVEAVAAVAMAAQGCEVWLELYHSFIKPNHYNTDQELLEHFLDTDRFRLTSFYGHLDKEGMAELPPSVTFLGLAINSAVDAAAVSDIEPWENLQWLRVSVSCGVAACDLVELPCVDSIGLHFPGITDSRVDTVRPAIDALLPERGFQYVAFPLSHLTAAGAGRLVQQLRGLSIEDVTIEPCGAWQPGTVERKLMERELCSAVGCSNVDWHLDWLYNP